MTALNTRDLHVASETTLFDDYSSRLQAILGMTDWSRVEQLAKDLLDCWKTGHQVFLCGNGGSAANAMHIANDLLYGIARGHGPGLRTQALPANASVLTCLANDEGYDDIFSLQLAALAQAGDILIVLSGSGNSPNVLKALEQAKRIGMRSFAILGYAGGKAKAMSDVPIHFAVDDMQISEDLQLIVAHMVMQWLCRHRAGDANS
jgi:D-sedoheptulose 7-phosphate isomerase